MAFKFNPFTGTFDLVGSGGSSFDPDTILTGYVDGDLEVLIDSLGNVLIGV
jgi:hypothetical protein